MDIFFLLLLIYYLHIPLLFLPYHILVFPTYTHPFTCPCYFFFCVLCCLCTIFLLIQSYQPLFFSYQHTPLPSVSTTPGSSFFFFLLIQTHLFVPVSFFQHFLPSVHFPSASVTSAYFIFLILVFAMYMPFFDLYFFSNIPCIFSPQGIFSLFFAESYFALFLTMIFFF